MNNLRQKFAFLSLIIVLLTFASCSSDEDEAIKFTTVNISVLFPEDYTGPQNDLTVTWSNITTKIVGETSTNAQGIATLNLEEGNYDFTVSSTQDAVSYTGKLVNTNITGETQELTLNLEASYTSTGWIIKAVYFSGSRTPADKSYYQDQYIELYNNSDHVLYADGLIFSKTYENSQTSPSFPDYLAQGEVIPSFIFQVPGSGQEHSVEPGKSLILCNQGLNHQSDDLNPNSPVDLSTADFEWYDNNALDVDVPEVPNLLSLYSTSASINILHMRGYEGYFIYQIPVSETAAFLTAHEATGTYPNGSTFKGYAIPKQYILDAIQCAKPEGFESAVFPATLETGYSYCDGGGTGKAVERKVDHKEGDRYILVDSNNSTADFTPNATPSPRQVVE